MTTPWSSCARSFRQAPAQRPQGQDHGGGGRRHAGGYVCSASFKGAIGPGDVVKQVAAGDRVSRAVYSKEQRAFYQAHAPEGLGLDDLSVLGPINVLKLRFTPCG